MTVTPFPRNAVRIDHRQTNRIHAGEIHLPITDEALDLIPASVLTARDTVAELIAKEAEAMGAAYLAAEAIRTAETADASALAEAIRTGTEDPGSVHATAARTAKQDADRRLAGTSEALRMAREDYWQAINAVEWAPILLALEAKAAASLAEIPALLATVAEHRRIAAGLRGLALRLEAFPNGTTGLTRWDEQDFRRSIKTIEDGATDILYPPLMVTQGTTGGDAA